VTEFLKPGKTNVLAVETFAPTEKDLGINWVDWNPSPPDKDMGCGAGLIWSRPARSPCARRWPSRTSWPALDTADLTVYASCTTPPIMQ